MSDEREIEEQSDVLEPGETLTASFQIDGHQFEVSYTETGRRADVRFSYAGEHLTDWDDSWPTGAGMFGSDDAGHLADWAHEYVTEQRAHLLHNLMPMMPTGDDFVRQLRQRYR